MLSIASLFALGAWLVASKGDVQQPMQPIQHHGLDQYSCFKNNNLPNVTVYATGGTIAGSSDSRYDTSKYQWGVLEVKTLIDAVPAMCERANVRAVQVANVGSHNVNSRILVDMAYRIQKDLDNPYTQGVVVTHGTDTLEETAFFLDLTISSDKPVVIVGAMRPATAYSADGPMNLLTAVTLAGSKSGRGRGAMIVMNDRIGAARFTTKANANRLDSFQAVEQGFLGTFESTKPVFFYPPSRPLGHRYFNISKTLAKNGLPKVDILYGHQEVEAGLFRSSVDSGAKGVVLAGVGGGWWPTAAKQAVDQYANKKSIPVLTSRRPAWGYVDDSSGGIGCGFLDPQKCRIQLQLCLETGVGLDEIDSIFQYRGEEP